MGKGRVWMKIGAVVLFLTAAAHLAGHLAGAPEPANDQERQLLDLMQNYKMDLGGMERSTKEILDGFSLSYSVFLFFAGLGTFVVVRSRDDAAVQTAAILLAGLTGVQLALAVAYFIIPPIVCLAVAWICFVVAIPLLGRRA